MVVAACEIDLRISSKPRSLKEKRMIIRSLKDRIRNRFEVAVAEVDYLDLWQRAALGVACVSRESKEAESMIQKVLNFIDGVGELEIVNADIRLY